MLTAVPTTMPGCKALAATLPAYNEVDKRLRADGSRGRVRMNCWRPRGGMLGAVVQQQSRSMVAAAALPEALVRAAGLLRPAE